MTASSAAVAVSVLVVAAVRAALRWSSAAVHWRRVSVAFALLALVTVMVMPAVMMSRLVASSAVSFLVGQPFFGPVGWAVVSASLVGVVSLSVVGVFSFGRGSASGEGGRRVVAVGFGHRGIG